jgi:transcription termination factor NusB
MDISHRIHARKVVLSYFYQRYFFLSIQNDATLIKESLAIAHSFPDHDDFAQQQEDLVQALASYATIDSDEMIEYLVSYVFDKRKDDVDAAYLVKMIPSFDVYYDAIQPLVDTHATTFSFVRMDTIDKALFLLGYAEFKVL